VINYSRKSFLFASTNIHVHKNNLEGGTLYSSMNINVTLSH
jgi:hypothetical protein